MILSAFADKRVSHIRARHVGIGGVANYDVGENVAAS